MDILNVVIGGMQEHQTVKTDGVCHTLTSLIGCGGGYIPMVIDLKEIQIIGRMDNSDGTHESQNRVYSEGGVCPTINTMQGGNLQPKILWIERVDGTGICTDTASN